MKLLMISTDRKLFEPGTDVWQRTVEYGALVEELHVLVFTNSDSGFAPHQIAERVWLHPTNSWSRWLYPMHAVAIGRTIIKERGITMVTTQDPFETGWAGLKLARLFKLPFQVQIHTDLLSPFFRVETSLNSIRMKIAETVLPQADCIRVVSERIRTSIEKRYKLRRRPVVLPVRVDVGLNGVGSRSDILRRRYPQFGYILLIAGRLEHEKNVPIAVQAFHQVHRQFPGVGMVIVGDGSEREKLERMVEEFDMFDKVVFEGWDDNIAKYYGSADLFLLPSLYEGYARSLIESALATCPILSTDVGIVGEIFDETSILIAEPGNPASFTTKLAYALANRDTLKNMALKAREQALNAVTLSKEEYMLAMKNTWENCGSVTPVE